MISITVSGQDEVEEFLAGIEDALEVESILDQGAALLLARIRERFLAQVDPDGKPWIPSFSARIRAFTGRGGGTLFDTGRLFHSIQVYHEGKNTRSIGTDVPYAKDHQLGLKPGQPSSSGRIFKHGLPARRFLGFNEEDVDVVTGMVVKRIEDMFEKYS